MNINCCSKIPVFQLSDLRKLLVAVLVTACENEVDIRDQHASETLYTNFGQILRHVQSIADSFWKPPQEENTLLVSTSTEN